MGNSLLCAVVLVNADGHDVGCLCKAGLKAVYTQPTWTMHVLQKDSATIAEFARALGVATPMLQAAAPLYDEADAPGHGDKDVAAIHSVLARRAGIEMKK